MRKILALFVMLVFSGMLAFAQNRMVIGTITDDKGAPIEGASVRIKGSKTGVAADAAGNFRISVTSGATLVFSGVGIPTKEVAVGNQSTINLSLVRSGTELAEVTVVTGVGVATSKKKLGISVESISSDKLPKSQSIDQALVGKIAGAQISSVNGSPGSKTNILLRGINTINRGTTPMILLDGVEVKGTDLNSLDLNGIERIEVVQGAASATIYGAQGANGVIQLFSKKGKIGKTRIDISSSVSSNEILNIGNVHKSEMHPFKTNANNEVIGSSGNPLVLDPDISLYRENVQVNLIDPNTLSNHAYNQNLLYYDHYKMFLQKAYTTNNSIAISGASDKFDFNISASDNRQTSTFRNNGKYSRSNLISNIGIQLAKNLKFRSISQLVYTKSTLNDETGRGIFFALNNSRPFANYDYKMPDGSYGYYFGDAVGVNGYNPNYQTQYSTDQNNKIDVIQTFNLNYKPIRFLDLDVKYGLNYETQDDIYNVGAQDFNANTVFNKRYWTGNYYSPSSPTTTGSIDNFRYRTTFQNFLSTATFNFDFDKDFHLHIPIKSSTQVAFDYRKNLFKRYITYGGDAPAYTPYTASQLGTYKIQDDYTEPFVTYGYLVNQHFDYKDIIGVTGGFRSDYSSAFGGGSKPFTFPHFDGYLRVSQFGFWNNSIGSLITEFKLRGAYGKAGIQPRAFDRYVVLNTANIGTNVAFRYPTNNPNPDLSVEVSKEVEFGTDITLKGLKGNWLSTINLSATYWDRTTDNAIYNVDAAPSTGIGTVRDNAFGLASNGFQASLNVNLFKNKNLSWDFTSNFSKQTSKITSVKGGTDIIVISNAGSSNYVLRAGEKIGQLYGYLLLHSVEETKADGTPYIPKTEQFKYALASNGWVVDTATRQPYVTPGKYALGDPNPKFNMSFINDFTFKDFLSFSMQWDWVNGSHLYNQTKQWMYRDGIRSDYAIPITIPGNPVTGAYTAFYRGVYAQRQANGTKNYFYEDASFVRLRNISIAVDFAKFWHIPGIQRLQLVLSGRNLVTFTDYTGFDPEVSSGTRNSAFDRGVDHNTIPNLKSYQVGLNLGF